MNPSQRTVLLAAAGLALALGVAIVSPELWPVWVAFSLCLLLAMGFDVRLIMAASSIEVESQAPASIYIGKDAMWTLSIRTAQERRLRVLADLDPEFEPQNELDMVIGPDLADATIRLLPRRRGRLLLKRLWLHWSSPLGLFNVTQKREIDTSVTVVPDLGTVRATAMQFFGSSSSLSGLKTERYLGDGSEFASLREYVPGLDARSIDWKSTVRHRKLMCRQFRAERNHQVIFAIDTGHLMREPLDGVPRVDHAINRALLLSYVCLKTGDRVGMYAFDAEPRQYLEPQGGLSSFGRLQQQSSELDYGTSETNYALGILDLSSRLRRRSLVVVFTEFIDSVTAQLMSDNLDRLSRRHVVIFVTLRDPALESIENGELSELTDISRSVVACNLRLDRELVLRRLQRRGIHVVDANPDRVSVELINRYIEIKRREFV